MKKTLALALALAMLCALPTVAYAKDEKIEGFVDNKTLADGYLLSGSGWVKNDSLERTVKYSKPVKPGSRDYINLSSDMFEWEDDTPYTLTGELMRNNHFSAQAVATKGESVIEDVSIDHHQRQIVIQYASTFATIDPVEFEFNVHLLINGKRYRERGIVFSGTMENPVTKVTEGPKVLLNGGGVIEAKANISKIRIDLGPVSVTTALQQGEKYYVGGTDSPAGIGTKIVKDNPSITTAISLQSVGLDKSSCKVKLHSDYAQFYVYDKDLNYLGRGDAQLAYYSRYYLSKKKLNV